jgi:hypothetical protein
VGAAPRARTTDFGKGGVAADIFGHRAHKVVWRKGCIDARVMHTLSDDKKDGYKIGILSLYPWHPEKEHSQTTFFQSNKAPEQREDLIRGGEAKKED